MPGMPLLPRTRTRTRLAALCCVALLAATADAKRTGKVLATDLNKGKIDVFDPNTKAQDMEGAGYEDWKLFTLLRKAKRPDGQVIQAGDQNNWAAGHMVEAAGTIYAISQCTGQCQDKNMVLKINATTGDVDDSLSAQLLSHVLYDLALFTSDSLLVATNDGIKKISTGGGAPTDYWTGSDAKWRQAEVETVLEGAGAGVYVLLYAKGAHVHLKASDTTTCPPNAQTDDRARLYFCPLAMASCSSSTATELVTGLAAANPWGYDSTDIQPSPQSLLVFGNSAGTDKDYVDIVVVERDNDPPSAECSVSSAEGSGNQGVHHYNYNHNANQMSAHTFLLPMSSFDSGKAQQAASDSFSAVETAAKTSAFDFMSVQVAPDSAIASNAARSSTGDTSLYITDYSAYNAPLVLTLKGTPTARHTSAEVRPLPQRNMGGGRMPFLGTTTNIVPTGFTLFTQGPWAPMCTVTEWSSNGWSNCAASQPLSAGSSNCWFVAGETPQVTVNAKQYDGTDYTVGDGDFKTLLEGTITEAGEQIKVSSTSEGSSAMGHTYTAPYLAPLQKQGKFTMSVVAGLDGGFKWHVAGSPTTVYVVAGATSAAHSLTSLQGTQVGEAGVEQQVTVASYDQYGNPSGVSTALTGTELTGTLVTVPAVARADFFAVTVDIDGVKGSTLFAMALSAPDSGKFSGSYKLDKAASYRLSVQKLKAADTDCGASPGDCEHVQTAITTMSTLPVDLSVRASTPVASKCTATGPPLKGSYFDVLDTTPVTWNIAANDQFSNLISDGASGATLASRFVMTFEADDGFAHAAGSKYKAPPARLGSTFDGQFFVMSYTQDFANPANHSEYRVLVTLDGVAIRGSPFAVRVSSKGGYTYGNNTVEYRKSEEPYEWPHALAILVIIIAVICIVMALALMAWIQDNRLHQVVAVASPFMCNIILLGAIASYMSVIFLAIQPKGHPTLCSVRQWTPNLAFAWMWGAVMLKLRRTYLVAVKGEEGKLKRTKSFMKKERRGEIGASNKDLMIHLGLIMGVEALIQLVYVIAEGPTLNNFQYGLEGYEGVPPDEYCYSSIANVFFWLDLLYHIGILVYTVVLAFQTRKIQKTTAKAESRAVQKMLNESIQFSFAIYNTIVVLLACHAMGANAHTDPGTMLILDSVASLFPPVVASLALIGPKIWMIKYGDHSMKSVMGLKRQQEMSKRKLGGGMMAQAKKSTQPAGRGDEGRQSREGLTADTSFDASISIDRP